MNTKMNWLPSKKKKTDGKEMLTNEPMCASDATCADKLNLQKKVQSDNAISLSIIFLLLSIALFKQKINDFLCFYWKIYFSRGKNAIGCFRTDSLV